MVYFICSLGLSACLSAAGQICDNMSLSEKYRDQKWSFSSISRVSKDLTKYIIYCEKDGEVIRLEE